MMTRKNSVLAICIAACLGVPVPAAPQTGEQKPPPAAEKKLQIKAQKPEAPAAPRRKSPKQGSGNERFPSDVPVSFPADI